MDQTGKSRTRIPEFVRNGRLRSRPKVSQERARVSQGNGASDLDRERNVNKKTVTMAPVSRCMTSKGQYVARKPLLSTERHTSILKNPLSQELTSPAKSPTTSHRETHPHKDMHSTCDDPLTSCSTSKLYNISSSLSREGLTSPLTISDLSTWPSMCQETPLTSSPHSHPKPASQRSPSSALIDAYCLPVPQIPKFTSTQRSSPTTSSRPLSKTDMGPLGRDSQALQGNGSKVSPPPFHQMSPYQANYWTCAIPISLPPSPDRKSPNWDPDKEYEALLDYTYPLRPGHVGTRQWNTVSTGQQRKPEGVLEDSGIELDPYCSSSTLSFLDQTAHTSMRGKGGNHRFTSKFVGVHCHSPRELSMSKSSDGNGRLSSSLYSDDHIGVSVESLECVGNQRGQPFFHYKNLGIFSSSRSPATFIPTLHVLPRPGVLGDVDEEFLALPEQLQEIQVLSQHLRDISGQVIQPITSSWESLEQETSSTEKQSVENTALQTGNVGEQTVEDRMVKEEEEQEDGSISAGVCRIEEPSGEVRGFESRQQMLSTGVNRGSIQEVASIMGRLGGGSLFDSFKELRIEQLEDENKESLMQHIQTFCSNLEELIQWLYQVVKKMEVLTPPSADIDSVKASLADYKSFQKDVHAHRPLTGAVLDTGERLLCCMSSTSPVLKETLVLVEKQSRALETHAEHLFSSILSAMDCLVEASSREGTECSD